MNFFSLPRHLWWSHHFAFLLHDYLAHTIVKGEEAELFLVKFPLSGEGEVASLDSIENDDILDWLRKNEREEIADGVVERVIVHGLLMDMCQFLFESIESAAKGKVGVAFALLRKPFRDQLFTLEWILADPNGFFVEFCKGPEAIDLCDLLRMKRPFMEGIVRSAITRSAYSEFVDFDLMWELRFDKSTDWSLERLWNQAIHLVTTHQHYRTETENLNFTFLKDEDRSNLLRQFYQRVPMVLIHACGVVQAIVERWNPLFHGSGRLFGMRMLANAELWLRETDSNDDVEPFAVDGVNSFLSEVGIACAECKEPLQIGSTAALEDFVRDSLVRCGSCGCLDAQLTEFDDLADDEEDDLPSTNE